MDVLTGLALILQTEVRIEIRELNGLHGVTEHFEREGAESLDIHSLSLKIKRKYLSSAELLTNVGRESSEDDMVLGLGFKWLMGRVGTRLGRLVLTRIVLFL